MKKILPKITAWFTGFIALFLYFLLESMFVVPNKRKSVIIGYIITLIIVVLILLIYHQGLRQQNSWHFTIKFSKCDKTTVRKASWAILAFAIILLVQVLIGYILGSGATSQNQTALNQLINQEGMQFKVFIGLVAPIIEETIFRGIFFNLCFTKNTKQNMILGIITNGLVFAIFHDPEFSPFIIGYWLMGSMLAFVYLKTRDLKWPILVHMANNLIGLI
ncbi:CPBP family intramembrane metalloprotease [Lactobacillus sp. ESL0679]|uniref:CPBP family intramembrane glutamic endopeptidase n=1 Tax=Lactobacillus sp. ESL0679 TaxID=2983209 RepID=UPI0023F7E5E9|nr:CPBP family intramembrane glutamic endopeptidase [Lactobacillus sp. ESL0679]MDF7683795.1 CPBP family intramembrane metalloprotease [Lactobacillus sp. ESL0679]